MNLPDISNARLSNQWVHSRPDFSRAKDVVAWMTAIQAQDYAMSLWAIGLRGQGLTEGAVQQAADEGQILRTHLLRPTWHFVAADDIWWLLELSAPHLKAHMKSRFKQLGISPEDYLRCSQVIEKALMKAGQLNRAELLFALKSDGVCSGGEYLSHLLLWAELEGVVCSGAHKNNKVCYALLEERVPKPAALKREEALAKLAHRYFSSHCPATLLDFKWWSGLSLTDAKKGLEMIKHDFIAEQVGLAEYWLPKSFSGALSQQVFDHSSLYLLPAFDEFLVGYKDRTPSFQLEHQVHAFTNNGIFHPVVVVNGQVKGVWKRTIKGAKVLFEASFFYPVDAQVLELTAIAARNLGGFFEKKIEIVRIG